jgi:glycosyltransferase involved in cell wall biosynthesis
MSAFFSIVLPTYNRACILPGTIRSVIAQTFGDWELIIVDDCSSDKTEETVKVFNDDRIRYTFNETNRERGYSRNKGISLATGRYVCFLDSDDEFLPNHLQVFYDHLAAGGFPSGLFFTNKIIRNDAGEIIEDMHRSPAFPWKNKFAFILRYTFNPTRVCVSREVLDIFQFDITIPGLEDIDLWLRIATRYDIYQITETTNVYYVHAGSYSQGDVQRFHKELRNFRHIFSKQELKDLLPSNEKRLLLGRCHYFLSLQYFEKRSKRKMLAHALSAFLFNPSGYNENANRTLFIIALYSLPFVERLGKIFRKSGKK